MDVDADTMKVPTAPSRNSNNGQDGSSPFGKSRYGRAHKPKISEDFYNIDVIFECSKDNKKSPRSVQQTRSPTRTHHQRAQSPTKSAATKSPRTATKLLDFVHVTGDTENAPTYSFAGRLSRTVKDHSKSETMRSPQRNKVRVNSSSVRKEGVVLSSAPLPSSNTLNDAESVDVTKVLKIISVKSPDPAQPDSTEAKCGFKPALKTYTNKRRNFNKGYVVESFGLPDKPIFPIKDDRKSPLKEPKRIKNLDVSVPCSGNDVNLVDKELLNTPWKIRSFEAAPATDEAVPVPIVGHYGRGSLPVKPVANSKTTTTTTTIVSGHPTFQNEFNDYIANRKLTVLPANRRQKITATITAVKFPAPNLKLGKNPHEDKNDEPSSPSPRKEATKRTQSKLRLSTITVVTDDSGNDLEPVESPKKEPSAVRPRGRPRKSKPEAVTGEKRAEEVGDENRPDVRHHETVDHDKLDEMSLSDRLNLANETADETNGRLKRKRRSRASDVLVSPPAKGNIRNKSMVEVASGKSSPKRRPDFVRRTSRRKVTQNGKEEECDATDNPRGVLPEGETLRSENEGTPTDAPATTDTKREPPQLPEVSAVEPEIGFGTVGSDYKVGDIMWSRIRGYPFWPCLVIQDPDTNEHKRTVSLKGQPLVSYHVRFFGDKGRRTWVYDTCIMKFTGKDDLTSVTPGSATFQSYRVRPQILPRWKVAVEEAEAVRTGALQDRLDFFDRIVNGARGGGKEQKTDRGGDWCDDEDKAPGPELRPFRNPPVVPAGPRKRPGNRRGRKLPVPPGGPTEESLKEHDRKTSGPLPRNHAATLLGEANSECSLSDTDSVSKSSSSTPVPNGFDARSKRRKQNHLFKGVSKERVCQVCREGGDVLKCRGPCNGLFHRSCGARLGPDECPVKKEPCAADEPGLPDTTGSTEEKGETSSPCKVGPDPAAPPTSSSKVEIVYVDCDDSDSEHALAPKAQWTSGRDFSQLSLAEKIDAKMKEIMQKVERKTRYADSTTDYTSSEDSSSNLLAESGAQAVPERREPMKIRHVTADYISFTSGGSSEELLCENTDAEGAGRGAEEAAAAAAAAEPDARKEFRCCHCAAGVEPPCFVCGKQVSNKNVSVRQKCSLHMCGKFYHPECLKLWPQTQWSLIAVAKHKNCDELLDTFVCPAHVCHTCASDNPHAAISRCPSDKAVRCLRCPATYHTSACCVPAGAVLASASQMVCPRHLGRQRRTGRTPRTINTPWCFICSEGGDLICCETCPTSVHSECLALNLLEDGTFMCEDCETGRFPLYDEIVWVKLGTYRWWPAVILFPSEVPDNVRNIAHSEGEFAVKFFGTHDHYWVGRGRVFLFQEGDKGHCNATRKRVDSLFKKSIEEATAAHHLKKLFKSSREAEIRTGVKPPPYIRVKVNKPVGNVRLFDGNVSNTTSCECDPNQDDPCGPDTDCLNRLLLTECDPDICPAGDKCCNQRFEKRQYPPLVPCRTQARGWGLKTLAPIRKGDFVIEYVGEIIDEREYQRRIRKMHEQKDENYYFLTIDKDRIIDAGPKGNLARFMNHCCHPNCETQKWTVNGDTRVGLFALDDIPVDSELTFNYNLECIGKEKKICKCGAPNCSGFIGVKAKSDEAQKKLRKGNGLRRKKAPETSQASKNDSPCFVCGETGDVGACHNKICTKSYHLRCVNLECWPEGKWVCPWHNCNVCTKRTIRCCVKCVNSYCPVHSEGNVRYDKLSGFVCTEHDPTKESQEQLSVRQVTLVKNVRNVPALTTEETDVTSTTTDEIDRLITGARVKERAFVDGSTAAQTVTSTPIKNADPDTVARALEEFESEAATVHANGGPGEAGSVKKRLEEKSVSKRGQKRGRKRRNAAANHLPKRIKLSPENVREKSSSSVRDRAVDSNLTGVPTQNEIKLSLSVPSRHLRAASRNGVGTKAKSFLKRQNEFEKDLPMRKRTRPRCEASS